MYILRHRDAVKYTGDDFIRSLSRLGLSLPVEMKYICRFSPGLKGNDYSDGKVLLPAPHSAAALFNKERISVISAKVFGLILPEILPNGL